MDPDQLREEIRKGLLEKDPAGIYFADVENRDEYDPEIDAIITGLPGCKTENEFVDLLWSVFEKQFGAEHAGSRDQYVEIAKWLWPICKG